MMKFIIRFWLLPYIFGLTHALNGTVYKKNVQENFDRYSKDAYEGIVQYLSKMVTIANRETTPELKTEQMISELNTLKDIIDGVIEAAETFVEDEIEDSVQSAETEDFPKQPCKLLKM